MTNSYPLKFFKHIDKKVKEGTTRITESVIEQALQTLISNNQRTLQYVEQFSATRFLTIAK